MVDGKNIVPDVHAVLDKMTGFANCGELYEFFGCGFAALG